MVPSTYAEFDTASQAKGYSSFKSKRNKLWEINCASMGAEFTQNAKLFDSNTSGNFVWYT